MNKKLPSYISRLFRFWLVGFVLLFCFLGWAVMIHHFDSDEPFAGSSPISEPKELPKIDVTPVTIPPYDSDTAEYVLFAFPSQGVFHITDADKYFTLLPPQVTITAQLIKRGLLPEPITKDVHIRYTIEGNMTDEEGNTLPSGELSYQDTPPGFISKDIPLMPYTKDGKFMPYPIARIEALDMQGKVLAETKVTLPVSTEIGCHNCHTGKWKKDNRAGITDQTAMDILEKHDKFNNTDFVSLAKQGVPVDCQSCHFEGGEQENISASIHGFHATLQLPDPKSCYSCHPASPKGSTNFAHDLHSDWGLDCTNCHGGMADHAASLLKQEADHNKQAKKRLQDISDHLTMGVDDIKARLPFVNLPDCTSCHDFMKKPDPSTANAFNKWSKDAKDLFTNKVENMEKIRCATCHGVQHAVYPSNNPLGDDRDNIQPLQYQGISWPIGGQANCKICHTQLMDFFVHHDTVGDPTKP